MANATITDELRALIRKRGSIKAQMTNFETFLSKQIQAELDALKLKLRIDQIKSVFTQFNEIQSEIESFDEDNSQSDERYEFEERYFDALVKGERLLAMTQVESHNYNGESTQEHASANPSVRQKRRIKLPEASLPTFNGCYENWLSFKDAFTTMIHNQSDLNNLEKFQYLRSALKGEAARKIQIFSITEDNYLRAWELVQKSYADKRVLISRHLNLLLSLPVQDRETAEGLIKLADETQQHRLSLSSLGIDVNEEIIVQNLENKLHKATVDKWDETLQRDVFPKLDEMLEFLYRTAARLSNREGAKSRSDQTQTKTQSSNERRHERSKKHVFVTTMSQFCPVCKDEQHPLYRCEKFRALSIPQRRQVVKNASLCMTCLRTDHNQKDCKLGNCLVCNQRHNTLLHQSREHDVETRQA